MKAQVRIVMGSESDWEVISNVSATFKKLGISSENRVLSAHRAPGLLTQYCEAARGRCHKIGWVTSDPAPAGKFGSGSHSAGQRGYGSGLILIILAIATKVATAQ